MAPYLEGLLAKVQGNPNITIHMESQLTAFKGFVGNYVSSITAQDGAETRGGARGYHPGHRRP